MAYAGKKQIKYSTFGKVQIGCASFVFLFALLVSLPSISACLAGQYWGCEVVRGWDVLLLTTAGVISLTFATFGILNLRRDK